MQNEKTLDISWGALVKIFLLVLLSYMFYQIKHILVWFIFAVIIAILTEPAIVFLRRKISAPRLLSVFLIYFGVLGIFTALIYWTVPLFISESQQFSRLLPQYFANISPALHSVGIEAFNDIEGFINFIRGNLESITSNFLNILVIIFGGFFAFVFILSIAIFISLDENSIERALLLVFPKRYENYLLSLWKRAQKGVTSWFASRILACLFVGIATYIALLIFRAPYPFSFGLMSGVFNFIPVIGPIVTALLLFFIIGVSDIFKAIFVVIVFTVIQQIEGSIITPLLSKKFIGISPVLVLFSLAVGGILWGFLGSILAVPLAAILVEFFGDFIRARKEEEVE